MCTNVHISIRVYKNKTKNKTKNNNTSPAHILNAWQRGGVREAYGDPPRCLHSVERVTAFRNKATTLASSSSCLKTRHVVDVFSEADFGPTTRTSIFSRNLTAFCKKSTAPRRIEPRQTASNGGACTTDPLKVV